MKSWYTFTTNYVTQAVGSSYSLLTFTVFASSLENAWKHCSRRMVAGSKVIAWVEGQELPHMAQNICCNLCSGPWNEANGHIDLQQGRVWCGTCTADMVKFLKAQLNRPAGKLRFYDHAGPVPESPPVGWEPGGS